MRTRITTAVTLTLLLTITACGSDSDDTEPESDTSPTAAVGETVTITPDSDSTTHTTIDFTITDAECGLDRGVALVSYNDGTHTSRGENAPTGWEYCRFDITITNTGATPTQLYPWPKNVIAGGQTIAPGDDMSINTYATTVPLGNAQSLNPGASLDYTVYRSYPEGTSPDSVEIARDEFSSYDPVTTITLN